MKKGKTNDAIKILHNRYIKNDVDREVSLESERSNAQIAKMIYDLRQNAELSQTALANLIGTTQSVISRLEDADYEGHSLSMLHRIAKALDYSVSINLTKKDYATKNTEIDHESIVHSIEKMLDEKFKRLEERLAQPRIIVIQLKEENPIGETWESRPTQTIQGEVISSYDRARELVQ